jgi:hypothetical protein
MLLSIGAEIKLLCKLQFSDRSEHTSACTSMLKLSAHALRSHRHELEFAQLQAGTTFGDVSILG